MNRGYSFLLFLLQLQHQLRLSIIESFKYFLISFAFFWLFYLLSQLGDLAHAFVIPGVASNHYFHYVLEANGPCFLQRCEHTRHIIVISLELVGTLLNTLGPGFSSWFGRCVLRRGEVSLFHFLILRMLIKWKLLIFVKHRHQRTLQTLAILW